MPNMALPTRRRAAHDEWVSSRTVSDVVAAPHPDEAVSSGSHTSPGFVLGVVAALAAAGIGLGASLLNSLVSPLLIAIVLGIVVGNTCDIAPLCSGLDFAGKVLLRAGIVLLGLQLSLTAIAELGWGVLVLAAAVVASGLTFGIWCGRRLGLTASQAALTTCGFSICGAAAVAAADGVLDADEDEVATSIGLVVLFGSLMIPVCVGMTALGMNTRTAGFFVGGSVHEVAQVVAAGGLIGGGTLTVAVVVKLARVLMLAPMMTLLAMRRRRELRAVEAQSDVALPPIVPGFVLAFIAAVFVRSFVPVAPSVLDAAKGAQAVLLAAAMFALGTGVTWSMLKRVGSRPFVHALACTAWVAAVAGLGAWLLA